MTCRMSEMSVFNGSWNNLATEKGVERTTEKIVKAIADGGKQTQKVVEAVKVGSEKVVDAVAKIKPTTNAEQTAAPKPATETLHDGLKGIAASASRIADAVLARPNEVKATMESATTTVRQFTDLVDRASRAAEDSEQLRGAAAEATKTSQWLGGDLCGSGNQGVPVVNALSRVCDF